MTRGLANVLALDDFAPIARRRLPRMVHGYIDCVAERGQGFHDANTTFADLALRPRTLVDTRARSQAATLMGQRFASPFGVAPMGGMILAAEDGDVVLAKAAAAAGIPFVLSASSLTPLERVAREAPGSWFQGYLPGDDEKITAMIERLERAEIDTLVLTVDVPLVGNRENTIRAGFNMPVRPTPRLFWDAATHPRWFFGWARAIAKRGMPHFENMGARRGPPALSRHAARSMVDRDGLDWSHLRLMRDRWRGRLVLKGVLTPEDARLARDAGCDGIVVSNHGGRQLDGAVAPMRVLADVAAEAGDMAVMLDGGIRRGTDVLKALALGAHSVLVGRPFLFAAAAAGGRGIAHAIGLLREEIDRDMALLGVTDLAQVGPHFLVNARA